MKVAGLVLWTLYIYVQANDGDALYKKLVAKGFTPRSEPRLAVGKPRVYY